MVQSPWFVGALIILTLLAIISAHLDHLSYSEWAGFAREYGNKNYGMENRVMIGSWVGTDRKPSSGLFAFLLPLLCLLPGAGSLIEERSSGYQAHALSRVTDGAYYRSKAAACFLTGGLTAALPLLLSCLMAAAVTPYGHPSPLGYLSLSIPIASNTPFSTLYFSDPLMYMSIWIGIAFFLCGFWATAVLGASLFVSSPIRLYVGAFILQIILNHIAYSINMLFFQSEMSTVDLFTLLIPSGFETGSAQIGALLICLFALTFTSIILPLFFFKRRCYL